MLHTDRYNTRGISRLAHDVGLSKSAVSRFVRGLTNPTYGRVQRMIQVLEQQLGKELPLNEVVSETGHYATKFICELVGCPGCQPDWMFDSDNAELPQYRAARKGRWTGDVCGGKRLDGDWTSIEEIG